MHVLNALTIENLYVKYGSSDVLIDVSLKVPHGVRCAIVGPNGAGKTTLLKSILGLIKIEKGTISFWDKPYQKASQKIAYVPQRKTVDWSFPITVHDAVSMGVSSFIKIWNSQPHEDKKKISDALHAMKLTELQNSHINNLSGGQQQRIFIARSLVQDADLYLLDEPLTGLDKVSEKTITETFKTLQNKSKTIIAVHHDWHTLGLYFDWVIFLNKELIYCGPYQAGLMQQLFERTF